jgi:hypothetical protein
MRRRKRGEAGEGNFGCLVGLVIMLAGIFIAYKIIPVKVKAADLRQVITDESKSAGQHNDGRIRAAILTKAREVELPVTDDEITINRTSTNIHVTVEYTVPIDFPGKVYQWHIKSEAENPIF